jgi:hypothetical protein
VNPSCYRKSWNGNPPPKAGRALVLSQPSGRSRWQQGLVATCEDFLHEAKAEGKKSQTGLANESVGAMTEE